MALTYFVFRWRVGYEYRRRLNFLIGLRFVEQQDPAVPEPSSLALLGLGALGLLGCHRRRKRKVH